MRPRLDSVSYVRLNGTQVTSAAHRSYRARARKSWRAVALALLLAGPGCASAPTRTSSGEPLLPAGVAAIDITPEEPIRLTGYGNRSSPAGVVAQRLFAKAMAFGGDGERPAVLITTDVIGMSSRVTEELAKRLAPAGIERGHLAITSTHTHTGPSLAPVLPFIFSSPITPEQQRVVERYTGQLTDKLERVAREALADRRPARVSWGQGTAGFAAHRRVMKDGKWAAFGIDPKGPVDHDLPLLAVRAPDGALRAVLISYACHATTFEARENFVHGDWPGMAQQIIQQRHPGAIALVAIGAGADANPNPRGGGMADVERHAREVAAEVDRLLATALRPLTSTPAGRFRYIDLAFSRIPTRQEWEGEAKQKGARGLFARAVLDRLNRGEPLSPTVPYPVQTWRFGRDLSMIFLGGEVVSEYGLRLKRELGGSRPWVNAYSNDVSFYVASRRMIPEGGYEVESSMVYYGQPAPLAAGTEDQIVRAVRELLER